MTHKGHVSIWASMLVIMFSLPSVAQNDNGLEFYTQMAMSQTAIKADQEIPPMRNLPEGKRLSWSGRRSWTWMPMKKIGTKEDMLAELALLKERYSPFMKDIAPKAEEVRRTLSIDSMQFRLEDTADQADFSRVLRGEGEWKDVPIPYYHGPAGNVTAWYRKEIEIAPEMMSFPVVMLHFQAADYYTDAFVNGHHIGFHEGMLDEFEFDMKPYLKPGKNVITIKLRNEYPMMGDQWPRRYGNKLSASNSPGWDDPFGGWQECPAGFGIYQDLTIVAKNEPYIRDIFCRPLIDQSAVEVWTEIEKNDGSLFHDHIVKLSLYGQNFDAVVFEDETFEIKDLVGGVSLRKNIYKIPSDILRLWTPDEPWLYQIQVKLYDKESGALLDTQHRQFGMRSFVMDKNSKPKGRMYLNGKEIRLRGCNTMGFLQGDVVRHDFAQLEEDLLLAKLTNMNFIRTTQRIMPREVYEYGDRLGMMFQSDLPLFCYLNQKQFSQCAVQAGNIERVLRNHPSVIILSLLNEPGSGNRTTTMDVHAYQQQSIAEQIVIHNENPDRVIKQVEGDGQGVGWEYPDRHVYAIWYDGSPEHRVARYGRGEFVSVQKGWMFGCGEFGAEGLPSAEMMRRRFPQEFLATAPDGSWTPVNVPRCQSTGTGPNFYEAPTTLEGWSEASQDHQEWGVRLMARAYRRMPRMNSFAVHLFIDAWPNGWQKAIMDCERTPKKAWYSYRDALTPLAVQVESERNQFFSGEVWPFQIWVCNDTQDMPDAEIRYVFKKGQRVIDSGVAGASIPTVADHSSFQGFLDLKMPSVSSPTEYSVSVALIDKSTGRVLHEDSSDFIVRPSLKKKAGKKAVLVGDGADARHLTATLGLDPIMSDGHYGATDIILVSDSKVSPSEAEAINSAVKAGATAIVLKEATDAAPLLTGVPFKMDPSDKRMLILYCQTGHRWVQGLDYKDFKSPYSAKEDIPVKYRMRPFTAEGVAPVLAFKTGTVVGEKPEGKGRYIICSLALDGMLSMNPPLAGVFDKAIR